jgi:hypothetical protein
MQTTPNHLRFTILVGMILAAAAFRIIPHPPNFSPIAAIALFGGAQFSDKRAAFLVPLAAMFLGDLVLGFHALIPVIYCCFALIVCLGFQLRRHRGAGSVALSALASSVFFFVVSNFAVWIGTDMYPRTIAGLGACFIAALPYFQNTLAGDAVFNAMLFGGLALAEWRVPRLRESCPA